MSRCQKLLVIALASALGLVAAPRFSTAKAPRVAVVISVDQMRQDYLTRLWPFFSDGGFKRLVNGGANFTDAHYDYCVTLTGPGHAVQATGTWANRNGYVNNSYFDRTARKMVGPASDTATKLVGVDVAANGASPRRLLAGTLGDRMRTLTGGAAKVIALTLKDRASVPLAGHQGQAYWFDKKFGRFVTSTYYRKTLPDWLQNTQPRVDAAFGSTWDRFGPSAAYALASADDASWEEDDDGLGRTFPRTLNGKNNTKDKSFYSAWRSSPAALTLLVELAKEAMTAEGIGADDVTDLFWLGLTPTDYAGHSFGPYSHEAISLLLETDRVVANLLTYLDKSFGKDGYVVVLTADHGAPPIPEHAKSLGRDAGRVAAADVLKAVESTLNQTYGKHPGKKPWIAAHKPPFISLNRRLINKRKLSLDAVQQTAAHAVARLTGIDAVFGSERVLNGRYPRTPLVDKVTRSFHPTRSGDLYVLTKPYWLWSSWDTHPHGTSHGTPYAYDTHVPLVFYGAGVARGTHRRHVQLIDLAPTLASLIGMPGPDRAEGHILEEVFGR
ncbi:MAG: putative AlkP superfamily pyrophosphatase or phosphodiesterase [Myxococcota bacterium]|jgi:predicted AlkP superfamily pyrophosphatase or phosphodiesterase